jgi:hypothetical protein
MSIREHMQFNGKKAILVIWLLCKICWGYLQFFKGSVSWDKFKKIVKIYKTGVSKCRY